MKNPKEPLNIQISLSGEQGSGKSVLLKALMGDKGSFQTTYKPTEVIDNRHMTLDNIAYDYWELVNNIGYQALSNEYLKSSNINILLFNVENMSTFDAISNHGLLRKLGRDRKQKIILVATHLDSAKRTVSKEAAIKLVDRHKLDGYFEISSRTTEGIETLKEYILRFGSNLKSEHQLFDEINTFTTLAEQQSPSVAKAIHNIAFTLRSGLGQEDSKAYFQTHYLALQNNVHDLRYTSKSLLNSALDIIALVFACCSVVGIAGLWLSGELEKNKTTKGSSFMFFAFGERQQADVLIHNTISLSV